MKKYCLFILVLNLFLLVACGDTKNTKLIIGSWQGSEWLVNGKPSSNDVKSTSFTFEDKGEYSYENAGTVEKGTFRVQNNKLYTTPTGQQEIMVQIATLTNDSLVFDMNRGGQPEKLILLRKK